MPSVPIEAVGVHASGWDVGAVAQDDAGSGVLSFEPAWAATGVELA